MNAKKSPPTQAPDSQVGHLTAAERGATLKHWIRKDRKLRISDFAQAADIHPATLARYFSGQTDIAGLAHEMANKLLIGMGISDSNAWELLDIPEVNQKSFRSFRPPPLGSGPDVYRTVHETLPEALFGETVLPAQTGIELEPENLTTGIQIIELLDGRFHAVQVQAMPQNVKRRLGRLVTAHFGARQA